MKRKPQRLIIYPYDVVHITGKAYNTALRLMQKIRDANNKPPRSNITVNEFCLYMGLREEDILMQLG
ncbi:MAG: hypothetical protein LBE34_02140 [Flavobacteriaceae bacterium]|jgi:hypothetical protein|nr:hypothetical protein [Flavobacteriaceae bacterium]